MGFKVLDKIRELEAKLFCGYELWIFKGYVAVNKSGAEKIIDEIYASLPDDVRQARFFLKQNDKVVENNSDKRVNVYDVLKRIEILLDESFVFGNYSIVDKNKMLELEGELKDNLPSEIYQAEKLKK